MCWKLDKLSPPVFQYSLSSALKQLIELQLELLSFWFFRVSPRTVNIDYSKSFLFVMTAEIVSNGKRRTLNSYYRCS